MPGMAGAPPGPRGWPVVGVAPAIARDPYGSLQRLAREHGDVVRVPVPGVDMVLVSHPDHVRHVMTTRNAIYPKGKLFGESLWREGPRFHGMADGDQWRSVRKMLNPKFGERGLAPLSELMIETVVEAIDAWPAGTRRDMQDELSILTMSVMLRTMFTRPVERAQVQPLADAFADLMRGMAVNVLTSTVPGWVPRPYSRRTTAALDRILAYVDAMVADRRRHPVDNGDLLNMLLDGRFEDGTGMPDEQIRRELVGLIIGGYETTAAVMSWVLARLPFAPDAQARAYQEVDALGGRRVTHDDMEHLTWLRACFDEAQRLQGFPLNARQAAEDDEIGGYAIPKGTIVAVSGYTLHRDPRFWAQPDAFDPRRWLEDEIDKYAFLPFGVGPRRCLGTRMGYMVGMYTLATAFQRFRFAPVEGWAPAPQFSFSTIVKGGVPMTIQERTA